MQEASMLMFWVRYSNSKFYINFEQFYAIIRKGGVQHKQGQDTYQALGWSWQLMGRKSKYVGTIARKPTLSCRLVSDPEI